MSTAGAISVLGGCELSVLDAPTCEGYLAWLLGNREVKTPDSAQGLEWSLAHCDDGVTWGRRDAGVWRLGSHVAPDISPSIRKESLQELRLFDETKEILIWRTDTGLRGRVIRDSHPPEGAGDASDPLRPSDDARILRGQHVVAELEHDFTHVGDGTGAEQVLPLRVTTEQLRTGQVRLRTRHYYEADVETGVVRIAATRLVTLSSGGVHGA